jgi:hypothetical protein
MSRPKICLLLLTLGLALSAGLGLQALELQPPTEPPAKYQTTKFGILYSLWQCDAYDGSHQPPDTSKALKGLMPWAPVPTFHWWGEPALGYYCLSQREDILRKHAEMLRDAGIAFVFLDITNWPDKNKNDANRAIIQPLAHILAVWNTVPNAPKIVPSVPLTATGDMFDYVLQQLGRYPNLEFVFKRKPLALVVDNSAYPIDAGKYANYSQAYTLRRMWGLAQPASIWSFMEECAPGFLASRGTKPCKQRITVIDGVPEQVPVTTAYQETYMSDKATAVQKLHGRTFVQQFATAFQNPEVPIVTITGWNEWIAQRFCLASTKPPRITSANCTDPNDHWPDGSKIFVDQYGEEYNSDIEPSKNAPGDFYYRLLKHCIVDFRKGQMCIASDPRRSSE